MMETQVGKTAAVAVAPEKDEDWYEHGFARVEGSRRRGVFSMPLPYAQTLLKWAGYVTSADLADKLVIDPACGSGNTLLAATQALTTRGRARRWGAERVVQEIEHCIWGLDPDPVACNVTEMRLRRLISQLLPDLPAARRKTMQLHIHQTDSLSLPADARFHLVVTNPPLASTRGVVVSYGGFEAKSPPRDVWLRFLEQSLRLVAYGGTLAIAIPEALLTKASAAPLRAEMLREWSLEHIAHLTGVFRSGPGTVMLLLRRTDPAPEQVVQWERIERLSLKSARDLQSTVGSIHSRGARSERRMEGSIPQASLATSQRAPWRYALIGEERAFVERMNHPDGTLGRAPLGEFVTMGRGAEIGKDAPEPSAQQFAGAAPLLRGIDIEPFLAQRGRAWLPASAFKAPPETWRAPKLLLPRASGRIMAALDTTGAVPVSALITLAAKANDPAPQETLLWLLATLNSRPMRAYLMLTQTAYQLARPAIDLDALRALPIVLGPADARRRLVSLSSELSRHYSLHGNSPDDELQYPIGQRLTATIEREIIALYGLTPTDLEIVERWQP
ncbi:MAG TPA: N-6 DNA methylase [Ktedonobacterales bacterium]|nr:N-6 DNA methylase [Ktedonobacterales bacterium]